MPCQEKVCSFSHFDGVFFRDSIPFMLPGLMLLPSSPPGKLLAETSEVVNTTCHAFKSV